MQKESKATETFQRQLATSKAFSLNASGQNYKASRKSLKKLNETIALCEQRKDGKINMGQLFQKIEMVKMGVCTPPFQI